MHRSRSSPFLITSGHHSFFALALGWRCLRKKTTPAEGAADVAEPQPNKEQWEGGVGVGSSSSRDDHLMQ